MEDGMERTRKVVGTAKLVAQQRYQATVETATERCREMFREASQKYAETMERATLRYERTLARALELREGLRSRVKEYTLFHYDQVPEFVRSQYIYSGYRWNYSFWRSFWSVFRLHNESFNIWSHLAGFIVFLVLLMSSMQTWLADAPLHAQVNFAVFAFAAQGQMLASSIFHWFCCMDHRSYCAVAKLDFTFIIVLIVGSCFPVFNYVFSCFPYWHIFFLCMMTFLGVVTLVFSWLPFFQQPQYNWVRALTFVGLAMAGVLAFPGFLIRDTIPWAGLSLISLMGFMYLSGAVVYATRVPERWLPGKFDTFFASHNIWHLFVIGAAYAHYLALYHLHQWWESHPCDVVQSAAIADWHASNASMVPTLVTDL
eukprot:CAMPEP_0119135252 /NCGR_PEP_ID=MMETSP1310-20130426/18923_1 /TAXON_ID=464262 /ORGANISM="Genus nov. species nov., Strain RCC2339" /LENGTH=370 /DNA_ID=CAMNT_0007126119 /DNA_START=48 /DNA_END=1160 /DNA_ORIENTATION=+